ncbi:GTPase IMAP family member 8 isoform X2 [Channa argus]|uniref:GTPase IMAP family member 8 isoform X2 n=1 Tax=Channa argus TaxID=215402 RepID=UPI00352003F2
MSARDLSEWDGCCKPQLTIVLLGGRNSGKSSLGNLLLGKEEFVTKERTSCSWRLGLVAGRRLTVVDTPGWWCDYSVQDTPELVKREILSSVSLCSPGPQVFLITVKVSSGFSEKRRRAVEQHVSLLGEEVWSHCMVVFTSADRSKHTVAEEHVQAGGKTLHWLSEKCRQRCHSVVLSEDTDISQLMEKIQKLVAENGNRVFEIQNNILRATAAEKKGVEDRALQRFIRVKKHRSLMRERLQPITDIRIVLFGAKGSGKTSALNTILSRETNQPLRRTTQCLVGKGVVFGRHVTVVDTPGWWMNYFCGESSVFDRREMVISLSLCPPGPHVFLLVIRVDRAYTETYRRAVQEHLQLISDHIWNRVIVLFSFGDWLGGTTIDQYIESEGKPLQWVIEKCGNKYHVVNNKMKGDRFQVRELIGKIEEMLPGCKSGWHYEIERKVVEELQGEIRRQEARAKERRIKKEKQRQMARARLENLTPRSEIRIVLLGGRKTDNHWKAIEKPMEAGGGQLWSRAVVLFSYGDWLGNTSIEQHIESEGKLLQRLVEKCGNRYHVLDNKHWGDGAQVAELIEMIEEMLGEESLAFFHRGLWKSVSSTQEQQPDTVTHFKELLSHKHQLPYNFTPSATSSSCPSLTSSEVPVAADQIVALPAGRAGEWTGCTILERDAFMSRFAASREGLSRIKMVNLPLWFSTVDSHGHVGLNNDRGVCPLSPRHPAILLVLSQTPNGTPVEENGLSVHSLSHPALRDQTLRRLAESGGLKVLIDQCHDSSLEELEAFIDAYFEMVWKQSNGLFHMAKSDYVSTEHDVVIDEAGKEKDLSPTDRKLSKLELLEEIRNDLAELRESLEHIWNAIQDLRDRKKQDANDTC